MGDLQKFQYILISKLGVINVDNFAERKKLRVSRKTEFPPLSLASVFCALAICMLVNLDPNVSTLNTHTHTHNTDIEMTIKSSVCPSHGPFLLWD